MLGLLTLAPVAEPVAAWTDQDTLKTLYVIDNAAVGAAIGTAIADGPGAIAGAVGGALWGLLGLSLGSDQSNAIAYAQAKQVYANELANITANYLGLAHYNAQTNSELANTTATYLSRQAEWGARALYDYQTAHGQPHLYNSAWVLQQCQVANSSTALLWNTQAIYDDVLSSMDGISGSFVGTYSGMSWGIYGYWDGSTFVNLAADNSLSMTARVTDVLSTTSTQYLYLNTKAPIYVVGASASGTLSLKAASDGSYHNFTYGENMALVDASSLNAGKYNINASGGSPHAVCGLAVSADTNSGSAYPALIVYQYQDAALSWAGLWWKPGTYWSFASPTVGHSGAYGSTPEIWISISSAAPGGPGGNGVLEATFAHVKLDAIFSDMQSRQTQVTSLITTANNFAQTYYNILVLTGGSGGGPAPMPEMIFPDPSQLLNLTQDQIYAIYLAYIRAMGDWFQNYSQMLPNNVTLSSESLWLVCRGPIYDTNVNASLREVFNETAVWTPYVSIQNMDLALGMNTFAEPGFFIVWGHKNHLNDTTWIDQEARYVPFTAGWKANVTEMQTNGTGISSITLHVTTIHQILPPVIAPITPPQGQGIADWIIAHWYIFVLIAGIVIIGAAAFTRSWIFLVVGLIAIAVGVLFWWMSGEILFNPLLWMGW